MLETNTAYPITETNTHVLSVLSGLDRGDFRANIGWCATYSASDYPRWNIVPRKFAVRTMGFRLDQETYP